MTNNPVKQTPQGNIKNVDEYLAETFFASGRYNTLFLAVVGIGFFVIYLLTVYGVLGESTPALLYISGAVLFMAGAHFATLTLARRKRGITARLLSSLSYIIFAILVTAFWEGFVYVAIVLILVQLFTSIRAGMPDPHRRYLYVLGIAGIIGALLANANPPIERLQINTTASVATLAFLGATGLLLITVVVVSQSKNYRNLRNQLLTSFIIIVTVPTLMATFLSTIGAYISNQSQSFNTLETVSNLKVAQAEDIISGFRSDASAIQLDTTFKRNALNVLAPDNVHITLTAITSSRSFARNRLIDLQNTKEHPYREIMVLNTRAQVEISTSPEREGTSFPTEAFYRQGSIKSFLGFASEETFGAGNFFVAEPIYDSDRKIIRGILVLRADASLIRNLMEVTPGFEDAETYLLNNNFQPLTKTRLPVNIVNTEASLSAILNNVPEGTGIYENYAGETVVGNYRWIEPLEMIFIAEIPLSVVINNTLGSTVGSAALALFAIIIAIAAVAISADSISTPISSLAETAKRFASGELGARATVELKDEIGDLGRAYNQMAEQLQNIIGRLEQRVSDRTSELESQSNRLRVAAEIARDATTSRNLSELLEQTGLLIQERFGFYHTGIFLLDHDREYAMLTSSPTDAGKQMIANKHKLRVGEVGIVGRVAATGESRVTLDTELDALHFNNPLLPFTRSEMALPLKVQNNLIGVLDVQSTEPNAFHNEDIAIMQLLSDQLAAAIERARLLEQVEKNLSDLEQAYGRFTREGWRALDQSGLLTNAGYHFDNVRIQPIHEPPTLGNEAIQVGNTVISRNGKMAKDEYTVAIPIKLRGQAIGAVTAKLREGYSQNTITTMELAIERLAASLESARLYEEARLRADHEQSISQVATAISASTDYEEILRTTVREIGSILNGTDVAIQILGDSDGQESGRETT